MGKTNDYEGIRRGLNILSIVGRAGLSHQDILSKLSQDGTEVDIRTIDPILTDSQKTQENILQ